MRTAVKNLAWPLALCAFGTVLCYAFVRWDFPLWVSQAFFAWVMAGVGVGLYRWRRKGLPLALRDQPSEPLVFWLVFLYVAVALGLYFSLYYPGLEMIDYQDQMAMVRGDMPFTDVHAVGHTLYVAGIMKLFGNPAVLVAIPLLLLALLYGAFGVLLTRQGMPVSLLLPLLMVFTACGSRAQHYLYLLKDPLYTVMVAGVTLAMVRQVLEKPRWKLRQGALLGVALAGCVLLRQNGAVIFLAGLAYFSYGFLKNKNGKVWLSMLAAVVLCIGGVAFCASQVLHVQHVPNGFSIQVSGKGVAAVVAEEGPMDPEERAKLDSIFSPEELAWMKEKYAPYAKYNDLLWERQWKAEPELEVFRDPVMRMMNNQFVIALGEHPGEVVSLYFSLLSKNAGLLFRDFLGNTRIVWHWDDSKPLFSHILLAAGLLLAMALCGRKKAGILKNGAMLLPLVANTLSIVVSATTNEYRYLLPTFALFPVLLPAIICAGLREKPKP